MALDKQIYCYGVDTSYFYDEEEKYWHLRLLRLYSLRAKLKQKQKNNKEDVSWKLKSCNRVFSFLSKRFTDFTFQSSLPSSDFSHSLRSADFFGLYVFLSDCSLDFFFFGLSMSDTRFLKEYNLTSRLCINISSLS